eukprot:3658299-Amphidinium_carterae.3
MFNIYGLTIERLLVLQAERCLKLDLSQNFPVLRGLLPYKENTLHKVLLCTVMQEGVLDEA